LEHRVDGAGRRPRIFAVATEIRRASCFANRARNSWSGRGYGQGQGSCGKTRQIAAGFHKSLLGRSVGAARPLRLGKLIAISPPSFFGLMPERAGAFSRRNAVASDESDRSASTDRSRNHHSTRTHHRNRSCGNLDCARTADRNRRDDRELGAVSSHPRTVEGDFVEGAGSWTEQGGGEFHHDAVA
jgi:hypothetical protein